MQENKMGTMPIDKLIISMSLPIMISMLVQALYNIVDSIFVAQISENALTAVSMAFPIQNLMIAVGVGTAVGVNALLARSLGERDFDKVNKIAEHRSAGQLRTDSQQNRKSVWWNKYPWIGGRQHRILLQQYYRTHRSGT